MEVDAEVTFYEYGKENEKTLLLIHASAVMWDSFSEVIPLLEKEFHLVVPALPGFDENNPKEDFTSIEDIADKIEEWFIKQDIHSVYGIYGLSMGGAVVIRLLANNRIKFSKVIIDAGITPYQLPRAVTRVIALKDFLTMEIGKHMSPKMMAKMFSSTDYSIEDLEYAHKVLNFNSAKTLWNTFDSCNNYSMPKQNVISDADVVYWYGEKEKKARRLDLLYVKEHIPNIKFHKIPDMDHGDFLFFHPVEFSTQLIKMLEETF